jgi:hypothetical protein
MRIKIRSGTEPVRERTDNSSFTDCSSGYAPRIRSMEIWFSLSSSRF